MGGREEGRWEEREGWREEAGVVAPCMHNTTQTLTLHLTPFLSAGPKTDQKMVDQIRNGVSEGRDTSVCLLNYKVRSATTAHECSCLSSCPCTRHAFPVSCAHAYSRNQPTNVVSTTRSLTHSLTHPLIHSPTHSLTHSPTHLNSGGRHPILEPIFRRRTARLEG